MIMADFFAWKSSDEWAFRRLEITALEDDDCGGLQPCPGIQVVLDLGLQCAQVVRYEHAVLWHSSYASSSNEPWQPGHRLVNGLVAAFLREQELLGVRWA